MTNEQINRAIAEACGFVCVHELQVDKSGARSAFWEYPETWTNLKKQSWLPDFCNDLNAIHEAEQQLWRKDYNLRYDYVDELGKILNPTVWHRMNATDMLDATARERAEAFLRTLGKWATVNQQLTVQKEAQP